LKRIAVTFAEKRLERDFEALGAGKYDEQRLYAFLRRAIDDLKRDPLCGTKIPQRLWPRTYTPMRLDNLWKYDLPAGWRLIYTVKSDEIEIVSIILEWFDHKGYERRFKY
jgi:Txe/YoeB family toxin of Txe-Axe toxin-antitoxin module